MPASAASLSATLVAIATILSPTNGFVPPKSSPSIILKPTTILPPTFHNNKARNTPIYLSTQQQQDEQTSSQQQQLQNLFTANSTNGQMSKSQLKTVPIIAEMLAEGDLLLSELEEMWSKEVVSDGGDGTIDVEGFVRVYNDIDDLFEDEEEEEEEESMEVLEQLSAALTAASTADETELTKVFATLTKNNGESDTITLEQLRQWEEITSLVSEGMLAEEEVQSLWDKSGDDGESTTMDLERFLKFNDALDDLFVFDDDEEEEDEDAFTDEEEKDDEEEKEEVSAELPQETGEEKEEEPPKPALPIITETDLPSAVLFSQLANENYLVGQEELNRWGELQEMIAEGELSEEELAVLIGRVEKAPGTDGYYLNEEGFCALAEAIDDLFEDVDDEDDAEPEQPQQEAFRELKEELLELLEDIDKIGEEEGRLLCGLDCNELEQERVLEVVGELERESYNKVVAVSANGGGAVNEEELIGEWELLYSSSSTMKYNEGLSGLAGGLTRFGGLKQKIIGTKYLSDVEYTEQVIGKLGGKSFEVKITGDWELKTELSLFTGKPANVLSVTPDSVSYGPRRDKADHWKSLGPMNMLLLSYIDEDLRIMRGNTSTDTLFIWRRC